MNKTKEPLLLTLMDWVIRPFLGKELNYPMVREILKLKLLLDKRRVPATYGGSPKKMKNGKKPKEVSRSMLLTAILYMLLGLIIGGFQVIKNLFVANLFSYGALIFVLLTVYINEYSAVLLDTTEKRFFGSLPIGKKELNVAKDIHIAYYIGVIAVSTMLPSIIAAVFFHGFLYGTGFILVGILLVLFCLHLAGSLYYLLLKFFSGERLKDILNTFQVFVTVAIILGYQIIPRLVDFKALSKANILIEPYFFFIPSAWFASFFSILFESKRDWYYFALAAIAVFSFLGLETVYRTVILKGFDQKLEKLTEEVKENKSLGRFSRLLCRVFSKDRQEKAFMELVLIQISRDRSLKLKLYPQLVNAMILPIIILFSQVQNEGIGKMIERMKSQPYYLTLYLVGVSSAGIYTLIGQAENKESKMFYQILPIANLSKCIRAGVKIVLFKYLSPLFLFMGTFFLAISGLEIWLDVVVIYTAFLFVTSLMIRLNAWVLPFSTETGAGNAGYAIFTFLLNFIVSGSIALIHFRFLTSLPLKIAAFGVLTILNFLLWKYWMNKKFVIRRD